MTRKEIIDRTLLTEKNLVEDGYYQLGKNPFEYTNVLSQLELWIEKLGTQGPGALPQIHREMASLSFEEPDFNRPKNYE